MHLYHVFVVLIPLLESVDCSEAGRTLLADDCLFTNCAYILHHVTRLDVSLQMIVIQKPIRETVFVRAVELLALFTMH